MSDKQEEQLHTDVSKLTRNKYAYYLL